jgi:predicted component of type VI protein secretion system
VANSSPIVVQAIAEQMLRELDAYEQLLGSLSREGWSPQLLEQLASQADGIYRCGQSLPRLAVSFTEFLITRTDLVQALWSDARPQAALSAQAAGVFDEHVAATARLRQACVRVRQAAQSPGRSGEGVLSVLAEIARKERPQ